MLVFSVLVFSVATFAVSFLLGQTNDHDKGKVAAYVTLIAWSSLIFGLYLGKTAL
jgi:hypothetical protein